jgi:hypothetical protein
MGLIMGSQNIMGSDYGSNISVGLDDSRNCHMEESYSHLTLDF